MAVPLRTDGKGKHFAPVLAAAGLVLWLALAVLGGDFLHAAYLKYSSLASPAYAMFLARRGWLWCHLAGGSLGVVLGLVQLITQRWPRALGVHRWCGRAYFAAMLVAVFGAAGLIATSPAPMSIRVAFSATMLAWLVTAGVGLVKILRRDVQAHRRWMLRAYVVTLAPAMFRLGLATAVGQGIAPSPGLIAWMLWGSWALPLLVLGLGMWAMAHLDQSRMRHAGA
ncbi:DUF2306 domain-containing protein [Pseudoxanthomonas composti]|uniref:DUF2306 domain-containing protein n=1 Tax=Pseudoxanthomonas composti TaxID=2137479 RepID=A0A4Q1JWE7_9GAMM|nr:DUF2306 domain-containing protein [Pseudoxanthomonas composti]RXR05968.1 DUF2306 domain-containing protein [Pseudoxanthomonas composti]